MFSKRKCKKACLCLWYSILFQLARQKIYFPRFSQVLLTRLFTRPLPSVTASRGTPPSSISRPARRVHPKTTTVDGRPATSLRGLRSATWSTFLPRKWSSSPTRRHSRNNVTANSSVSSDSCHISWTHRYVILM